MWGGTTYLDRRKIKPALVLAIRVMYYEAGMLEHRAGPIAEFISSRSQPLQQSHETEQPI